MITNQTFYGVIRVVLKVHSSAKLETFTEEELLVIVRRLLSDPPLAFLASIEVNGGYT
jgi:hypothetical protein